jgi:DNA-binding transcriptional MerR regulator
MITIGKLAQVTNLTNVTIRHYEKMGLLNNVQRSKGGYRQYSSSDIERLQFIDNAKKIGLSLEEIKNILHIQDNNLSSQLVKDEIENQINLVNHKIKSLQSLKSALEEMNQLCDRCETGRGEAEVE